MLTDFVETGERGDLVDEASGHTITRHRGTSVVRGAPLGGPTGGGGGGGAAGAQGGITSEEEARESFDLLAEAGMVTVSELNLFFGAGHDDIPHGEGGVVSFETFRAHFHEFLQDGTAAFSSDDGWEDTSSEGSDGDGEGDEGKSGDVSTGGGVLDAAAEAAAAAAAAEAAAKETARAMKAAGEVTDKKLRVRATIIKEIISTETTFVAGLSTLCEVYIKTLCTDKKLIKGGDVDIVFGGAQHLHGLNAKILIDLKAAAKMQFGDTEDASAVSGRVASVFARFAPYFKIFSTYVNNHANALLMLKTLKEKKKFVTALDLCNKEEGCMMGVESFLIMPVQRIPRYVLLLREILRHTSKSHDE